MISDHQLQIHLQNYPSAKVVTPSGSSQGQPVLVNKGDVINNIVNWHVAMRPHAVPAQGYPVGFSNEDAHYSLGPSATGAGVPQSTPANATFDDVKSGLGGDGRIANQDGTYGYGSSRRGF